MNTLISNKNLSTYYEQIKDEEDTYTVRDTLEASEIEALFEKEETTA